MKRMPDELVAAYASVFVHRWETYALQQRNGAYWRMDEPLSLSLLSAHLSGHCTLGTYLLDAQGDCSFAVFDDDREDGLMWLAVLAGELAREGIPTLLEASRRGGHLWVHLVEPTPGRLVRAWLLPYAQAFGMELYPKQDGLERGEWGSLIRLPLGVHQRSRGWYPFVVLPPSWELLPVGDSVQACCAWACANVQRVAVPASVAASVMSVEQVVSAPAALLNSESGRGARGRIRAWCLAQDTVSVIGRYVRLDRRGIGSCPFIDHHYRGDLRPSFQVFGGSDPHWYCYTWRRAGNLFDFLCLYHGLTVQEGYQRLRQGTLIE